MEKRDKSLLDLENKKENYNGKVHVLNNMRFNKPDMNINNLNSKFDKDNLLSFLNNFKKANDKIMNEPDKKKYNIEENDEQDEEENDSISNDNEINKDINLDENKEENKDEKIEKKPKKNKKEKVELDLLMGILEQQKKKEITINNIIENIKNDENVKNVEKGEEEIINFLVEKRK